MVGFTDLLRTAVGTATSNLAEGSLRNARAAIDVRREEARVGSDVLTALSHDARRTPVPDHRSA